MRILFACGGTAGHINPAIAVADRIRRQMPDAVLRFAGNPEGMEARLVPAAGFDFVPFRAMGLQRQLTLHNLKLNTKSAVLLLSARRRAQKLIDAFSPDIVVGTGGYVSAPVLLEAARMGIKTCTHEQNAFPGMATKMLAPRMDKVMLAVPEAKKYLPESREYIITGNPVRLDVLTYDREVARAELALKDNTFCLLSFGGSLGARRINEAISDVMAWHCGGNAPGPVLHIHATGAYGIELLPSLLEERGVDIYERSLDIREYISDMPRCLAAADLVICRSGAISLSELECAGKASILIPSPNVAENHQYHNAMALVNRGAAVMIEEKDLSGERLTREISGLMTDRGRLISVAAAAKAMAMPDAAERIAAQVLSLAD